MAKGRPRSHRLRRADGRLAPALDRGNAFVQARRAAFAMFQGGKAGDQLGDSIGRAWAAGLLDGQAHDPMLLRDIGRTYATLHAIVFAATQANVAEIMPRTRGTGGGTAHDPIGARYERLDRHARNAGSKARLAMRKLCIEPLPDEDPAWLARLIQSRRCAEPDGPRDRMILAQAVGALAAMAAG